MLVRARLLDLPFLLHVSIAPPERPTEQLEARVWRVPRASIRLLALRHVLSVLQEASVLRLL